MRYTYKALKDTVDKMRYFPIALNIKKKKVLIVGGGRVAERKVVSFLDAASDIKVIAPKVTRRLHLLFLNKRIKLLRRKVKSSDIHKAELIIAATSDEDTNRNIYRLARKRNIPVNVVDKTCLCDFITPAIAAVDKALIAVYTDGFDPRLSRDLKKYLKEKWDDFLNYRLRL
ncbi:MAG: bifunctional precorrin-2 dehydrogenase/sirohydrochlorin ferrochelatase [Candidatus Omnitrophota bacterium]